MTDSSRREFLKQGTAGIAAAAVGASSMGKGTALAQAQKNRTEVSANFGNKRFRDNPEAPVLTSKGGTGASAWVLLEAPSSEEETDREWCRIARYPGNDATQDPAGANAVVVEEGTTLEPFDGSLVLDTPGAGSYIYHAEAKYSGSATIFRKAGGLPVTIP